LNRGPTAGNRDAEQEVDHMARGKPRGQTAPCAETLAPRAATGGDAVALDPDAAYCEAILPRVSRTFALSIEALPDGLREPVRVAYLLCRVLDTVEDEPRLGHAARQALFDAFEVQLVDDMVAPVVFERACARLQGEPGAAADVALCRHAGAPLRVFRRIDRG
jgi:farnesyl-diphosphate farnesyltransferase